MCRALRQLLPTFSVSPHFAVQWPKLADKLEPVFLAQLLLTRARALRLQFLAAGVLPRALLFVSVLQVRAWHRHHPERVAKLLAMSRLHLPTAKKRFAPTPMNATVRGALYRWPRYLKVLCATPPMPHQTARSYWQ